MTWQAIASFALLCILLDLTPGPDSFLVLRHSIASTRAGIAAGAGSAFGSLAWAAAVGVGLAGILEQSATAYRVVKVAGGLYLLYLGVSTLVRSRRGGHLAPSEPGRAVARPVAAFRAGLFSNLLNPKVGLFFIAVVPQFLPHRHADFGLAMLLGAVSSTVALAYLTILACAAGRAITWLRRPRVAKALERGTAAVLAAFGLGTLVSASN